MKLIVIVMLLGACGSPQSRCEKFFKELERKTENCGINVGSFTAVETQCSTASAERILAEAKANFGAVLDAETCPAMKVRWEKATTAMVNDAKAAFERVLNNPDERQRAAMKSFDDAFKKAMDDAKAVKESEAYKKAVDDAKR
jgi:hypothetical protein